MGTNGGVWEYGNACRWANAENQPNLLNAGLSPVTGLLWAAFWWRHGLQFLQEVFPEEMKDEPCASESFFAIPIPDYEGDDRVLAISMLETGRELAFKGASCN